MIHLEKNTGLHRAIFRQAIRLRIFTRLLLSKPHDRFFYHFKSCLRTDVHPATLRLRSHAFCCLPSHLSRLYHHWSDTRRNREFYYLTRRHHTESHLSIYKGPCLSVFRFRNCLCIWNHQGWSPSRVRAGDHRAKIRKKLSRCDGNKCPSRLLCLRASRHRTNLRQHDKTCPFRMLNFGAKIPRSGHRQARPGRHTPLCTLQAIAPNKSLHFRRRSVRFPVGISETRYL